MTKFVLAIAKRVAEQYPCLFAETEAGKPCLESDYVLKVYIFSNKSIMLRRFSSTSNLVTIGIVLIAIAFIILFFLPSLVSLRLNLLISSLVNQRGSVITDSPEIIALRRIIADSYLLQNAYLFLTGIVLLAAGLFKQTNR